MLATLTEVIILNYPLTNVQQNRTMRQHSLHIHRGFAAFLVVVVQHLMMLWFKWHQVQLIS